MVKGEGKDVGGSMGIAEGKRSEQGEVRERVGSPEEAQGIVGEIRGGGEGKFE